jgi:hypothetical protein
MSGYRCLGDIVVARARKNEEILVLEPWSGQRAKCWRRLSHTWIPPRVHPFAQFLLSPVVATTRNAPCLLTELSTMSTNRAFHGHDVCSRTPYHATCSGRWGQCRTELRSKLTLPNVPPYSLCIPVLGTQSMSHGWRLSSPSSSRLLQFSLATQMAPWEEGIAIYGHAKSDYVILVLFPPTY